MKQGIFFVLLFVPVLNAYAIKPFHTDGCSRFPDGTRKEPKLWLNCCIEHDKDYWVGGSRKERLISDRALRSCVKNVGKPFISKLMYLGVRLGGTPYLPTKFRWGYKIISPEELILIADVMEK